MLREVQSPNVEVRGPARLTEIQKQIKETLSSPREVFASFGYESEINDDHERDLNQDSIRGMIERRHDVLEHFGVAGNHLDTAMHNPSDYIKYLASAMIRKGRINDSVVWGDRASDNANYYVSGYTGVGYLGEDAEDYDEPILDTKIGVRYKEIDDPQGSDSKKLKPTSWTVTTHLYGAADTNGGGLYRLQVTEGGKFQVERMKYRHSSRYTEGTVEPVSSLEEKYAVVQGFADTVHASITGQGLSPAQTVKEVTAQNIYGTH